MANHLGTHHENLFVSATDALNTVPLMPELYDEPFADSSQIPTYLVSKLTRQHVTVALSGDGGDELFGGYDRYHLTNRLTQTVFQFPYPVRRGAAAVLSRTPDVIINTVVQILPTHLRPVHPSDRARKAAEVLTGSPVNFYMQLLSQCPDPFAYLREGPEHPLCQELAVGDDFLRSMQLFDLATYLPDDILHKVDRASMASALEVRPPFLDHRIVEFAFRLPRHFLVRKAEGKRLLRRVLKRYVPERLTDRPKMGFGVPLAEWLRGPLREWSEDLLDPGRLGGGIMNVSAIRQLWQLHLSGTRNAAYPLWTILMFEAWRRRWAPG